MKGRKPNVDVVVPMTADGGGIEEREERFRARAREVADGLKPDDLDADVAAVWDRLAPRLAYPTVDRLHPQHVETVVLMCEARARYERLRRTVSAEGEFYATHTRNGMQLKARPEVAQMNESFRQFLTLARDFGLTPAAERALRASYGQASLFDDQDEGVQFA